MDFQQLHTGKETLIPAIVTSTKFLPPPKQTLSPINNKGHTTPFLYPNTRHSPTMATASTNPLLELTKLKTAEVSEPNGGDVHRPSGKAALKSIVSKRRSTMIRKHELEAKEAVAVMGREATRNCHERGAVQAVAYSSNCRYLVSGSTDGTASISAGLTLAHMAKESAKWELHSPVECLHFHPDGNIFAAGHKNGQGESTRHIIDSFAQHRLKACHILTVLTPRSTHAPFM